jgi:hypothetical protein
MKRAFAYWNERVAPVFDTTRRIYVVKAESGKIVSETQELLPQDVSVGGRSKPYPEESLMHSMVPRECVRTG